MSGSYYPPEPTPPPSFGHCEYTPTPPTPTPTAHDCGCSDEGGLIGNLLNLDHLLSGSISVGPGSIDVNLGGESAHPGALLSVVAGGEGLVDLSVDLDMNAIGHMGVLGGIDILDGLFCDSLLS
jgi:hypothetical protein